MAKKLKKLNYVESLMTFISKMQSSNWVDEDEPTPPGPTPSTLTPFSVGQSISGVDFGDVQNGDTNSDLDNFLLEDYPNTEEGAMLTWDAAGEFNLTRGKVKVDDNDVGLLVILLESAPIVVYATEAGTPEPGVTVTKGYQNLTDGKYMFSSLPAQTPKTIEDVNNEIEGWNGILVGAVEGQPVPVSLTPFSVGQSFGAESLKVNVNKTTEEVADVIKNMVDDTELVNGIFDGSESPLIDIIDDPDGGKCIVVADMPIFVTTSYEYVDKDSGKTITVPAGWQYDVDIEGEIFHLIDRETGIVDLSELFTPGMVVEISGVNSEVTGWNGEIVGYGNAPTPVTFTAFETNDTSDGIDFGNVNNGDTNSSLNSALEDLTEDTYVTFKTSDGISIAGDDGNHLIIYRNDSTSTNVILYATGAGTFEGTQYTEGYQNLTDGKYTFDTQKDIIAVSDNGKFTAINGILFGNYKVGE